MRPVSGKAARHASVRTHCSEFESPRVQLMCAGFSLVAFGCECLPLFVARFLSPVAQPALPAACEQGMPRSAVAAPDDATLTEPLSADTAATLLAWSRAALAAERAKEAEARAKEGLKILETKARSTRALEGGPGREAGQGREREGSAVPADVTAVRRARARSVQRAGRAARVSHDVCAPRERARLRLCKARCLLPRASPSL